MWCDTWSIATPVKTEKLQAELALQLHTVDDQMSVARSVCGLIDLSQFESTISGIDSDLSLLSQRVSKCHWQVGEIAQDILRP